MDVVFVGARSADALRQFRETDPSADSSATDVADIQSILRSDPLLKAVVIADDPAHSSECYKELHERARYLDLPVLVVDDSGAELPAVGAPAPVLPSAAALHDWLARYRQPRQAVPLELRSRLLGPFASATVVTLQEMAGLETTMRACYQRASHAVFGDISAVLNLSGPAGGTLALSFPEATATNIVRRVLAEVEPDPNPAIVRDCIGELSNVIAGQARGILATSPYAFGMSSPTVITGAGHEIHHPTGAPSLVVAFTSELGDFALQLCLSLPANGESA